MAADPLSNVRADLARRIAVVRAALPGASQFELRGHMDAVRETAAAAGLVNLEALARYSARHAMMPGHRIALPTCLEHLDAAIDSRSPEDGTAILAALALRLQ